MRSDVQLTAMAGARSAGFLFLLLAHAAVSAQVLIWERIGTSLQGPTYGGGISMVGDLNGDGRADLAVSAPDASNGFWLVTGYVGLLSGADGSVIAEGFGNAGQRFKCDGGVGDIDGDGVGDFVVSGIDAYIGVTWPSYLVSGASHAALNVNGFTTNAQRPAIPLGDVNADGFNDFALGPTVRGGPDGSAILYAVVPQSLNLYEAFGWVLAPAGDMNADGITDFLIGAPDGEGLYPCTYMAPGSVYAVSGSTGCILQQWIGPSVGSGFGSSVAGPGDVDGDGTPDVFVGAPGHYSASSCFPGSAGSVGSARLYSGATGLPLAVFPFPPGSGPTVGAAGDVDGDAVPDLGIVTSAGVEVRSGATAAPMLLIPAPGVQFLRYRRVLFAAAGDIDGDSFPDLVLAESNITGLFSGPPGRVQLWSLRPAGVSTFGSGCPLAGGVLPRIGATFVPRLGQNFAINLSQVPDQRPAALVLGLSDTAWAGTPLPLPLSSFGAPGCQLFVSIDVLVGTVTAAAGMGRAAASVVLALPPQPAVVGQTFYAQWGVGNDPGAASFIAGTQGLRIVIQP
jgi:hypothetical protein